MVQRKKQKLLWDSCCQVGLRGCSLGNVATAHCHGLVAWWQLPHPTSQNKNQFTSESWPNYGVQKPIDAVIYILQKTSDCIEQLIRLAGYGPDYGGGSCSYDKDSRDSDQHGCSPCSCFAEGLTRGSCAALLVFPPGLHKFVNNGKVCKNHKDKWDKRAHSCIKPVYIQLIGLWDVLPHTLVEHTMPLVSCHDDEKLSIKYPKDNSCDQAGPFGSLYCG